MSNPNISLQLYLLVLVASFLLTPRWGKVRDIITTAATSKVTSK